LLRRPGEDISYNEEGVVEKTDEEGTKRALVKIAHYTPKRTHHIGVIKGSVRDCVSMWKHESDVDGKERWH
jgi:hypothetical protein